MTDSKQTTPASTRRGSFGGMLTAFIIGVLAVTAIFVVVDLATGALHL
ncbi:hypothetical protein [uncultured Serinicoccus sp.]|nr:hypothetical protein [uncultured Serinicoccus sp.]